MNLKSYYWYFQSVIPERICDEIIRYGKEQNKEIIALTRLSYSIILCELEISAYFNTKSFPLHIAVYSCVMPFNFLMHPSLSFSFTTTVLFKNYTKR